ncbi:MAG: hypothetical protein KIT16_03970 [Rhodospirillaceae bacterium]|nr:hypothetical protein [Rhodospirillaceae bacterium]
MSAFGWSIAFSPLLSWQWLYIFAAIGAVLVIGGAVLRARGIVWRFVAVALAWLVLANPSLVVENREGLRDVAVVVIDESASQNLEQRRQRSEAALEQVRQAIQKLGNMDLRIVRTGNDGNEDGTRLFGALERALADIPRQRLAGVIMITDGQVHDAPVAGRMINGIGPLHILLSGRRDELDRRLAIESAPSFGLIGKPLQMRVKVDDGSSTGGTARIVIKRDGVAWKTVTVRIGRPVDVEFELDKRGTTFFELEVEAGPRELTLDNNRAVVAINGIRDRLRVLLISGEPHAGQRSWRNILKSDPGVDLVHFTILRPPEKRDYTPINELSLISFPVRELFEEKLDQFDLIIFDRYRRRGIIRNEYYDNIVKYVRKGGALLVADGPTFAGPLSIFNSPLGDILPARPTGEVIEEPFRPKKTDLGKRHPVTAALPGDGVGANPWGRWFRLVGAQVRSGYVLLSGAGDRPLMVVDRVDKGRVALLLSDQAWLWDRGYEGGGPQAELLRRFAHWLMKEPELEEEHLSGTIRAGRLDIVRRSMKPSNAPVKVTGPDGKTLDVPMQERGDGTATGSAIISKPGLYRITDGKLNAMAAIGSLNAKEMEDVRTTDTKLKAAVEANEGSFAWLGDGMPDIRRVGREDRTHGGTFGGSPWIGLRQNGDYVVTGIRELPLMVGFAALLLALLPLLFAWRREGK